MLLILDLLSLQAIAALIVLVVIVLVAICMVLTFRRSRRFIYCIIYLITDRICNERLTFSDNVFIYRYAFMISPITNYRLLFLLLYWS
jgi:hypothetical protein